jgi:hypothetical protein
MLLDNTIRMLSMSDLYMCAKCGFTYLVEDGEQALCSKCSSSLVAVCEWCGKPEKECSCGKDEINVKELEE